MSKRSDEIAALNSVNLQNIAGVDVVGVDFYLVGKRLPSCIRSIVFGAMNFRHITIRDWMNKGSSCSGSHVCLRVCEYRIYNSSARLITCQRTGSV